MLSYLPKHPKEHIFQGPHWCHVGCSFSSVALIYFWSSYNLYPEQDNNLFYTPNHRLLNINLCNKFIERGLCARHSASNWSRYKESKALLPRGAYPSGWGLNDCRGMDECLADKASKLFLVSCQGSNQEFTLEEHQIFLLSILRLCDFIFLHLPI